MITDFDSYRSAWVLLEEHGEDAPIWAAQKADALLERGDLNHELLWVRILAAIVDLQATVRPCGPNWQPRK